MVGIRSLNMYIDSVIPILEMYYVHIQSVWTDSSNFL